MNPVGVVFRMESGADVQIVMPDPNARIIVRDWQQECLPKYLGNMTDPFPWMVMTSKIQAIQVVPLQGVPNNQTDSIPKGLPSNVSGIGSGRN